MVELLNVERHHLPSWIVSHDPSSITTYPDYLIFFLPGNPGLISYYRSFIFTLGDLLRSGSLSSTDLFLPTYRIDGFSYHNFEAGSCEDSSPYNHKNLHNLESQIRLIQDRLVSLATKLQTARNADSDGGDEQKTKSPEKIILVGHSVGAYMLLEVVRRWKLSTQGFSPDTSAILDIIGGILLFPTVTNIAKSPSGVMISVSSLDSI